ncbi:MAG: hypothetical protein AAGE59_21695 [Cyanobacteria bacterium P01_F01_bin.86]
MSDLQNSESPDKDKRDLLYPRSRYYGKFTPQHLAFNANLQEFAQRISYICGLETGDKISALEAYKMVKEAWTELKRSKKGLGIGQEPPSIEKI